MVPRDLNIGFQGLALIQGQIYHPEAVYQSALSPEGMFADMGHWRSIHWRQNAEPLVASLGAFHGLWALDQSENWSHGRKHVGIIVVYVI